MDFRKCLIIRADSRTEKVPPETAALWPPRLEFSTLFRRDTIDFGYAHLDDGRRYRGRHTKDQIERPRHRAADGPSVHQDLPNKRHVAVVLQPARTLRRLRDPYTLACALPPLRTLKVEIDKEHWASPSSFAGAGVHLRPQGRKRRVLVQLSSQVREATRVQSAHRSQSTRAWPTLRLDRRPQNFLLLSHCRFVSLQYGSEFSILPPGLRCGVSRYFLRNTKRED